MFFSEDHTRSMACTAACEKRNRFLEEKLHMLRKMVGFKGIYGWVTQIITKVFR